jgi:hypothetical protein
MYSKMKYNEYQDLFLPKRTSSYKKKTLNTQVPIYNLSCNNINKRSK